MAGRPPTFSDEQLRTRINAAATEVFATKGYSAATLDDIADLAGIRKPSIYRLYESKSALHRSLIEDFATAAAMQAMEAAKDATGSLHDRLTAIIDGWFLVVESDPLRWKILTAATPVDAETAATLDRIRQMQLGNDVALIRTLTPSLPESEVVPLAEAVHAALLALGHWWLDHREQPRAVPVSVMTRLCHGIVLTATSPTKTPPKTKRP